MRREGTDVTLVSWSRGLFLAQGAADELERRRHLRARSSTCACCGRSTCDTVVDSVQKTNRAGDRRGDRGARWASAQRSPRRCRNRPSTILDAPIGRVGSLEVPMPYAKNLERLIIPGKDEVIAAVKEVLE